MVWALVALAATACADDPVTRDAGADGGGVRDVGQWEVFTPERPPSLDGPPDVADAAVDRAGMFECSTYPDLWCLVGAQACVQQESLSLRPSCADIPPSCEPGSVCSCPDFKPGCPLSNEIGNFYCMEDSGIVHVGCPG